jgi:hypothetical protein
LKLIKIELSTPGPIVERFLSKVHFRSTDNRTLSFGISVASTVATRTPQQQGLTNQQVAEANAHTQVTDSQMVETALGSGQLFRDATVEQPGPKLTFRGLAVRTHDIVISIGLRGPERAPLGEGPIHGAANTLHPFATNRIRADSPLPQTAQEQVARHSESRQLQRNFSSVRKTRSEESQKDVARRKQLAKIAAKMQREKDKQKTAEDAAKQAQDDKLAARTADEADGVSGAAAGNLGIDASSGGAYALMFTTVKDQRGGGNSIEDRTAVSQLGSSSSVQSKEAILSPEAQAAFRIVGFNHSQSVANAVAIGNRGAPGLAVALQVASNSSFFEQLTEAAAFAGDDIIDQLNNPKDRSAHEYNLDFEHSMRVINSTSRDKKKQLELYEIFQLLAHLISFWVIARDAKRKIFDLLEEKGLGHILPPSVELGEFLKEFVAGYEHIMEFLEADPELEAVVKGIVDKKYSESELKARGGSLQRMLEKQLGGSLDFNYYERH